jgi:Bacteriophage minor capsid protein
VSVDEEICQLLHDLGQGVWSPDAPGGDIFLALLPESPDVATAVTLYAGVLDGSAARAHDQPRVQLKVRGTQDARTASARAQAHYDALVGLTRRPLTGGSWLCLVTPVQQGPTWLGVDELRRHTYVVNFDFHVGRATAHRTP